MTEDSKVIPFRPRPPTHKEPDDPHLSGRARCKECGYEHIAVAPVGAVAVPCPKCNCDAHLLGEVITGGDQWTCKCGYQLFRIDRNGPYCARCGQQPQWF